ncbi:DUF1080 domain-containing protein [Larkinella knui]|uniref:DUF1080 domain-containing protein n=1 Tax=Larkinella knui TaxID=2025310 RepID=A0A3P1CWI2_9BACT|nr:DUF1080 domain-containing protein [Larkinella knui]
MKIAWKNRVRFFTLAGGLLTSCLLPGSAVKAQTVPAANPATRPAGGMGRLFPATVKDDSVGFVPIFDGKTLNGWEGDATFWRAENGILIGETTPTKVVRENNFLIWRGGKVKDFEIKFDFKINGTNSGMQYRSIELPEVGKWILKGYQADLDFTNLFTGNVHEERGRTGHVVLARRGEVTRAVDGPAFKSVAKIADPAMLRGVVNINGWNSYHIIARGPIMIHIINNQVMSIAIDEDSKNFVPEGLIGFQMHVGPPFMVQYRNILYKKIASK